MMDFFLPFRRVRLNFTAQTTTQYFVLSIFFTRITHKNKHNTHIGDKKRDNSLNGWEKLS